MKKGLFYIFFLIILPVSFGSTENTGCNKSFNESENKEKCDRSHQIDNSSSPEENSNSEQ